MAKRIYITLICALIAYPMFSQNSFKERSENWLRADKTRGPAIDDIDLGEGGMKKDPVVPVGDTAWTLILGLGLTYGAYILSKKRKNA